MIQRIIYIGLMICFGQLLAQKEYHFYSDQPEQYRPRSIDNEFSYSFSQVKDKLYVNLRVDLGKKTLNSSKKVTFLVNVLKSGVPVNSQVVTDSYYNYDSKYYSFKIPVQIAGIDSATLRITNQNTELIGKTNFDIKFKSDSLTESPLYLYDSNLDPIITSTLQVGQVVVPTSEHKKLYVRFYDYESQKPGIASVVNSGAVKTRVITAEVSFLMEHPGFYEFDVDSTFSNAKSVSVVDNAFPRINRAKELLKPLAYLADTNSYKTIIKADNPKKALDEFWLGLTNNNMSLSKKIIRLFYQRVYDANEKFNAQTLGWKSHRGMTYILMGKPTNIETRNGVEIWRYTDTVEIRFVKNKWGVYEFENSEQLQSHFATAVENIKKGNID